eukprot:s4507_g1.t1
MQLMVFQIACTIFATAFSDPRQGEVDGMCLNVRKHREKTVTLMQQPPASPKSFGRARRAGRIRRRFRRRYQPRYGQRTKTRTSTPGPSTSEAPICQLPLSVSNPGAVGTTLGPAVAGTPTNTNISFNANFNCRLGGGTVLLDLGVREGSVPVASESQPEAEATPGASEVLAPPTMSEDPDNSQSLAEHAADSLPQPGGLFSDGLPVEQVRFRKNISIDGEVTGEAADGNPDLRDLFGTVTETSLDLDEAEAGEDEYDPGDWIDEDAGNREGPLRTFTGDEEARHRRFMFEQSLSFLPATMPLLPWEQGAQACWLGILEGCGFNGLVGNYVGQSLQNLDKERALLHIRDACGVRSPKTVLKRGRDLLLYVRWAERREIEWWPLREVTLLDYLTEVEKAEKSKFIGKNLVHALKFFKYIFGASFDPEVIIGPLLRGRLSRVLATRNPTEQARALTVLEMKRLEILCKTSPSVYDRYYIGCLLLACYARARLRVHKTSTSEERKAMYMPFVAPIQGVESFCWAIEWKDALIELGLLTGFEPHGAICRAPTVSGGFTKRPLTSVEASDMLNDYLGIGKASLEATSSHSLKATTLVWAARYGIGDGNRSILGHHALKENSLACYSRDLLSLPLRELETMMLSIRTGSFDPDGTRSGWMASTWDEHGERPQGEVPAPDLPKASGPESVVPSPSLAEGEGDISAKPEFDPRNPFLENSWDAQPENETAQNPEVEDEGPEVICSASSSGEDTADSDMNEEVFHKEHQSMLESGLDKAVMGDLMQNKRSRMLHKRSPDETNFLQPISLCGVHGQGFVCLLEGASFNWPKCSKCFKDEPKDPDLSEALSSGKRRKMV